MDAVITKALDIPLAIILVILIIVVVARLERFTRNKDINDTDKQP